MEKREEIRQCFETKWLFEGEELDSKGQRTGNEDCFSVVKGFFIFLSFRLKCGVVGVPLSLCIFQARCLSFGTTLFSTGQRRAHKSRLLKSLAHHCCGERSTERIKW